MPQLQGIDVSSYQGTIDWNKVKAAGKKFAFVKLGETDFVGKITQSTAFIRNVEGAIAAGIDVGVYIYSHCKTPDAAKAAAQQALEMVKPYKLSYPIALDMETVSQNEPNGAKYDKSSKVVNSAIAKSFLDKIESANYYAMLYTYKSFADSYLDMTQLRTYDVWIAQYADKCTYSGYYGIWQYTGTGKCAGITGNVDLNVSYIDYAELIKRVGLNGWAAHSTVKPQEPDESDEVIALRSRVAFLENKLATIKSTAESAL